jgi:hypothetical protein
VECADHALISDEADLRGCTVRESGDYRGDASGEEITRVRHLIRPIELGAHRKRHVFQTGEKLLARTSRECIE